jgi:hypothetical protein
MLCQLNIHMKNNKGYYSWIHSMKNAAMESHFNGQRMLKEAREDDYDPEVAARIAALRSGRASEMEAHRQRTAEIEAAQRAEIMSGRISPVSAGGESAKKEAKAHARAMKKSGLSKDVKPAGDLNGDGIASAQDVRIDTTDNVMGNEEADMSAEFADEMMGAGHGPLGIRFEVEGKPQKEEENQEIRIESVNQKISRFFKG